MMKSREIILAAAVGLALFLSYGLLQNQTAADSVRFFLLWAMIIGWVGYESYHRRRHEGKIRQMQKMESIGRLAGGIAHDFNNMLAGIMGSAEAIDMQLGDNNSLKKYTTIIKQASERLASLTGELLVFAREKDDKCEDVHLHEIVTEAAELLKSGLQKQYQLDICLHADNDAVCANRDLLESLILNLAVNAKDAMPSGGVIGVSTRNVLLHRGVYENFILPVREGMYIELEVNDIGKGIPKNIQSKIFEPFFTTKGVGEGTGLGLAAVYGIVRRFHGNLRFRTSPAGTSFYIYFPVLKKEKIVEVSDGSLPKIKAKFLIVDDEKILLELLKDILENMGAEVHTVSNAAEAAGYYQHNGPFDMVMLDLVMPRKGGLEIYEELRRADNSLKVVLMSGYTKDERVEKILRKDKNTAFMSKPYSVKRCMEVVNKLNKS